MQRISNESSDSDPAPTPSILYSRIQTGTSHPILFKGPVYTDSSKRFEPIHTNSAAALEACMYRESERALQESSLRSKVVYDCFDTFPQTRSQEARPFYNVQSGTDTTLLFESRFESGNLRRAIQIFEFEYDLILSPDSNTLAHTQWYYFTISNTRAGARYRFNIINMLKPDSLYNAGMKPCVYSQRGKSGWFRDGFDICYYQNNMRKKGGGYYYTLSFALEAAYDHDTVSVAHCYPYTHSDLQRDINAILADPKKRRRLRKKTLCLTMAGNPCDILTITSFSNKVETMQQKKGIWLMARVHPGESNASWMMKGVLEYLTGPSLDAKILRDNFVFKIVPMLNPDGVINGFYRCGLAGVDLNRCWIDPSKKLHPTIYHAKEALQSFVRDRNVILSCDFHGHSRKHNIFMFGCLTKTKIRERIFPRLLEQSSEVFSFKDCSFRLQKAKEATARIVIFKEFGVLHSYTIESSFSGANFGKMAGFHFGTKHLEEAGQDFCDAIVNFADPEQNKVKAVIQDLQVLYPPIIDEEDEDPKISIGVKRGVLKKRLNN